MNGLRSILQTNNTHLDPVNASAYGSTDLIRDTLQTARQNGGEPDLLIVSTNFMSGFATWGQAIQRIPAGETVFGTPINVLEAPFLHGVTIVEAPLLRPYTAIALTESRSTFATSGTLTGTCAATEATWSRATGSPKWRSRSSTNRTTRGSKGSLRFPRIDTFDQVSIAGKIAGCQSDVSRLAPPDTLTSDEAIMSASNPSKFCNRCGIQKSLDEFDVHLYSRDGRKYECKACILARFATKVCTRCGIEKPRSEFCKEKRSKQAG